MNITKIRSLKAMAASMLLCACLPSCAKKDDYSKQRQELAVLLSSCKNMSAEISGNPEVRKIQTDERLIKVKRLEQWAAANPTHPQAEIGLYAKSIIESSISQFEAVKEPIGLEPGNKVLSRHQAQLADLFLIVVNLP